MSYVHKTEPLLEKFKMALLTGHLDLPYQKHSDQQIFTSYSLQRSGQHLVINWICLGLLDVIHLNHCRFFFKGKRFVLTPKTGRRIIYSETETDDSGRQGRLSFRKSLPLTSPRNLFYSIEDKSCFESMYSDLVRLTHKTIIIIRDPANWLASSLEHGRSTKKQIQKKIEIFIDFLELANGVRSVKKDMVIINYNKFISSRSYRGSIASALGLMSLERAETALVNTPNFGGGSSFSENKKRSRITERWRDYQSNKNFVELLNNKKLVELSIKYWGSCPGFSELGLSSPKN